MIKGFEMELIKRQIDKYIKADKKTKKKIIDEYIRLCGIKRKAEIKIVGQECKFSLKVSMHNIVWDRFKSRDLKSCLQKVIQKICHKQKNISFPFIYKQTITYPYKSKHHL